MCIRDRHAAEHFYIVTDTIKDLPGNLPVLRIPDEWAYYKLSLIHISEPTRPY